jgi:hypothetical protein
MLESGFEYQAGRGNGYTAQGPQGKGECRRRRYCVDLGR